MRTCSNCNIAKEAISFRVKSSAHDGRQSICKDCNNAWQKEYRVVRKERQAEYYKDYRLKNKDRLKVYNLKWARANVDKCRAAFAKRKAAKLQAVPSWFDNNLVKKVYEKSKQFNMQVDHIIPLINDKVCGLHVWDNLQLLDKTLNLSKGNRFNQDW